jgi:hypothetical protein
LPRDEDEALAERVSLRIRLVEQDLPSADRQEAELLTG